MAASTYALQSWDVPGAYPRASADLHHRQVMCLPPLFDRKFLHCGKVCLHRRTIPVAPDAGQRWQAYGDKHMREWRWRWSLIEPGIYHRNLPGGKTVWLLADTDDLLVLSPTYGALQALGAPFRNNWQVTVRILTANGTRFSMPVSKIHSPQLASKSPTCNSSLLETICGLEMLAGRGYCLMGAFSRSWSLMILLRSCETPISKILPSSIIPFQPTSTSPHLQHLASQRTEQNTPPWSAQFASSQTLPTPVSRMSRDF